MARGPEGQQCFTGLSAAGLRWHYRLQEHSVPRWMNVRWHQTHQHGFRGRAVHKFLRLFREKLHLAKLRQQRYERHGSCDKVARAGVGGHRKATNNLLMERMTARSFLKWDSKTSHALISLGIIGDVRASKGVQFQSQLS